MTPRDIIYAVRRKKEKIVDTWYKFLYTTYNTEGYSVNNRLWGDGEKKWPKKLDSLPLGLFSYMLLLLLGSF
jgi:hypothetical protein